MASFKESRSKCIGIVYNTARKFVMIRGRNNKSTAIRDTPIRMNLIPHIITKISLFSNIWH